MIIQQDIGFHTPPDVDHRWGETYWFGLFVPEANLYGWVYLVFRAGTGAVLCDVEFIDRCSPDMLVARYIDIQNHLPIPERLDRFTLANGLSFVATTPSRYRLDYVGVGDTELHLDLAGIHEPYDIHDPQIDPMARTDTGEAITHSGFGSAYASHFDLTQRVTGTVTVRGSTYDVDCLATNDHSWGPRAERGMNMMGYVNAHFDDEYVVQTIWSFDASRPDGSQHTFKHGYAIVDGELIGGVGGELTVRHEGIFPRSIGLVMHDAAGGVHRLTGTPRAYHQWVPYGCCPTAHAMIGWKDTDGRSGVGTSMEAFPLDTTTGGFVHDDIRLSAPWSVHPT